MEFSLTTEQQMMRKMIRDFADTYVAPTAAERDEQERFDRQIFLELSKLGLTGIPLPEAWGGAGADFLSYVIAIEELSKVCASTGVTLSVHISLVSWPLLQYGSELQKKKYLNSLTAGQKLGAFALTEPAAGSDVVHMKTTAEKKGQHYRLNGQKVFVTNGGEADLYLIFAQTDSTKKHHGLSAFIVEADTPGLTIGAGEKKLGIRSSPTTSLHLDQCMIPVSQRLGAEGEGFQIAMKTLDGGRMGIAAQAVGIAQGAFDYALSYACERKQFGQPIVKHQSIQAKLANMAIRIEAARLLTYQVGWLKDQKLPHAKQAAMAKCFAADTAVEVTTEAIQILGGYGYTREYPVERMFRDAKITQIYEGTNEIQRLVIAKHLQKERKQS
ncbi:butyryl-CoA dehydrogenase [Seinonella peptonophila]|uniref:Acyl-CoA dehydrogenase n=1 Tax=Seinonella peptonophila TaxID=112248 RepID=A0A1M4XWV2_9BACL|nr:acyl-CoA dehydrogenase [Seinonella peptonophila]SHE97908.1 butyryl-CoA dehydrogenase [Seinonella peptonophila]